MEATEDEAKLDIAAEGDQDQMEETRQEAVASSAAEAAVTDSSIPESADVDGEAGKKIGVENEINQEEVEAASSTEADEPAKPAAEESADSKTGESEVGLEAENRARTESSSSAANSLDDDEADDDPEELQRAARGNDDDDDTTSDVSAGDGEAAGDEAEEAEQTAPTTEAAQERQLKRRMTSFDKRQEKFSLMKATVKTFDVSMEVVIGKWKRLREDFIKLRANSVLASGDDGSLMITRRMTEIGNMCSRTTNAAYYIATLPKDVQNLVKKVTQMPRDEFTEARRMNWSLFDRFMYVARMARVLGQACLVRRRLTIEALANGRALSEKDLVTASMSKSLRDFMCFCPEYRTKEMRQKILWFLRTNKVYTHLFSSEMEEECTKFVFYEKYQDGRILALCDRVPDKFYYVIAGRIERRRTYELRAGDYDRVFSVITKGHTSDPEVMETQRPYKYNLVACGLTEVLTLERESFIQLLKGTGGLPLKFLQGIGIFQEFPCERFLTSPEAITTRYFPKDRVILEDITDTQWIHVVKSGTARVVRKQLVFHYARNKYSNERSIGYAKPPSHSRAMQGLTERQRQYKAKVADDGRLPPLHRQLGHSVCNPLSYTIGLARQKQKTQQQQQEPEEQLLEEQTDSEASTTQRLRLPKVMTTPNATAPSPVAAPSATAAAAASAATTGEESSASVEAKSRRQRPLNMIARELQIPLRSAGSTRAGTGAPLSSGNPTAAARVLLGPDGFPAERAQREAYVVLDTLRSGDFLGFRNITALIEGQRIARDKENILTLLSDGAEIILISKRFFVQNAANNTMLKAETMRREFVTKEEASLSIDAKEDWEMFKTAFIQRMVSHNKESKKERQSNLA